MNRFDGYRVKIFMTGDSITEGDGNASAYRYQLFKKLYTSGAAFEFLGPNTSGDLRLPTAYWHHGGYCGITIGTDPEKDPGLNAKLVKLPGYAEAVRDCDIMLLWIGYNDYGRKIDLEHITDRLTDLIGKYHALNSDLILYVGTLFDYSVDRDINKWILDPATKTELEAKFGGLEYHAVDMNYGANRLRKVDNDFPEDDGHPAEQGNVKIAASWHDAIIGRVLELNRSKASEAPSPVRVNAISGNVRPMKLRQGESVTFTAAVKPDDAEVTSIIWSTSNHTVAKVDDYGRVTARIPGEAIITAESLDLGYKLSAKVTVYGGMLDLMQGYTTIFESDFTDKANWDGPEDVISCEYNKLGTRWNRTKTGEMTAKAEINVPSDSDFVMSYIYRTANDRTHGRERWISLIFAGLEMRITADAGCVMLLRDDNILGEWTCMGPVASNDTYAMKREGNTVSLYREGELLFAVSCGQSAGNELKIKWNDMSKADVRDIKIAVK